MADRPDYIDPVADDEPLPGSSDPLPGEDDPLTDDDIPDVNDPLDPDDPDVIRK